MHVVLCYKNVTVWSTIMDSFISYPALVTVQFTLQAVFSNTDCGSCLYGVGLPFDGLCLIVLGESAGCLVVSMSVNALSWWTTCAWYMLNGVCSPRLFVQTWIVSSFRILQSALPVIIGANVPILEGSHKSSHYYNF